ncbi:MAG: NADH-ubiquinone oxidoreductase-F iron-sulfur binding region domain-containing protein [Candidatus Bipolaricaulaceae bacterium]
MLKLDGLEKLREEGLKSLWPLQTKLVVGLASCGLAAGAAQIYHVLEEEKDPHGLIGRTGCLGPCGREPLVEVRFPDGIRLFYGEVSPERAQKLWKASKNGEIFREGLLFWDARDKAGAGPAELRGVPNFSEHPFYRKQRRLVLGNCGFIDPLNIREYIATGGYFALAKALEMEPEAVMEEVKRAGLRGRGGAGFPTGRKWELCRNAKGTKKYVICNGDEGDPGAYMDRSVLEGTPHAVIEGMLIGAYAVGADEGYIYVRAEYPLAVQHLRLAIREATEFGLLGENILGSGFSFQLRLFEGAGAFVCGEETALLASLEGRRGQPRPRPPFPVESGLFGKPTVINNVETWATVPHIVRNGADWFRSIGTQKSPGTKIFSLTGKIQNTGLVEVPVGTTLRELIFEIGGGPPGGKRFKAVQIGGPSGGCLPQELLDLPIDYESLTAAGAMMGSGGMVVVDETTCMVELARFFLEFTQAESCGQCPPCRIGTRRMLEILTRLTLGRGRAGDLELLAELASGVKEASLCGLGRTAPNPVLTTLRYFRAEYEEHLSGRCPAGVCKALITYLIDPELCAGCGLCASACPQGAILGQKGKTHRILLERCIRCGACIHVCPKGAIKKK